MENRIRDLRKSRGMNQISLSCQVGVSQQTISKIERDMNAVSMELLVRLAQFFDVTTDYLLGLTDDKKNVGTNEETSSKMEEYYNLVLEFEELDGRNQSMFRRIMSVLKGMQSNEEQ